MLIGVAAGTSMGLSAATYYLLAYLLTNLAAFGVIQIVGKSTGSDDISAYAGLSRRSPGLAFVMLIALLSLAGIPPFAGFIGKVLVFTAAMQANMAWLAILGVLNSIVALYYYLVIMKTMYSLPSQEGNQGNRCIPCLKGGSIPLHPWCDPVWDSHVWLWFELDRTRIHRLYELLTVIFLFDIILTICDRRSLSPMTRKIKYLIWRLQQLLVWQVVLP